jgi:uncharacterized protein (DUF983 family)
MVGRGLRRRCGRCGAKAAFQGHFRLAERCSTCGYRFAREEGFFTGVYIVNYAATSVLLVALAFAYLAVSVVGDESAPLAPWLASGIAIAVVIPIVTYPRAATTWAALDLAMRPLDPVEEAEALLNAAPDGPGTPPSGPPEAPLG